MFFQFTDATCETIDHLFERGLVGQKRVHVRTGCLTHGTQRLGWGKKESYMAILSEPLNLLNRNISAEKKVLMSSDGRFDATECNRSLKLKHTLQVSS